MACLTRKLIVMFPFSIEVKLLLPAAETDGGTAYRNGQAVTGKVHANWLSTLHKKCEVLSGIWSNSICG